MKDAATSMRLVSAIALLVVSFVSPVSVAKVNPEEFDQTAIVKKVTPEREIEGAARHGGIRYGTQFFVVTEIGDKVYDLSGAQRIEPGTYRAKINSRHNRVQFLLDSKDGNPKRSEWYKISEERQKISEDSK